MRGLSTTPTAFVCLLVLSLWTRFYSFILGSSSGEFPSWIRENLSKESPIVIISEKNTISNYNDGGRNSKKNENGDFDHYICVVTMTAPNNAAARQCQRKTCRMHEYLRFNIVHKFAVGLPNYEMLDPHSHQQGKVGTKEEVAESLDLLQEQKQFGDILVTPHRDSYRDLSEKRLNIVKYGVEHKCRYTFKTDDEYCLNATHVRELIANHEKYHPNEELYMGIYRWEGMEYPTMMSGPNNETAPYMSGAVNGVSNKLASYIVGEDWTHSALRFAYGTSSEDHVLGMWVDYAIKVHNISVKYVDDDGIHYERQHCNETGGPH